MTTPAEDLVLEQLGREAVGPAEFTRRLVERGELARVRGPLRRVKLQNAPRIAFMKDAAIRGALRWLIRAGGWRVRQVVAGDRRREGRVWSTGIWEALAVSYSPATLELIAAAARWCQPAQTLLPLPPELTGLAPTTTGDLLVFHMTVDALLEATPVPHDERPAPPVEPKPVTPPPPGTRTARPTAKKEAAPPPPPAPAPSPAPGASARNAHLERRRNLLAISPLTSLFRPDELLQGGKTSSNDGWCVGVARAEKAFAPLLQGDRASLLTYLDDTLAIRWIERETGRRALHAVEAGDAYVDLAAALEGFIGAARTAQRPDALRPLLRFYERYLIKFGQREAVALSFKNHSQSLVRASERARFLGQVARLFAVTRHVAAESERILATPFVDRTEAEKVFVADVSDFTRNVQPELEAIRRELAGEVG